MYTRTRPLSGISLDLCLSSAELFSSPAVQDRDEGHFSDYHHTKLAQEDVALGPRQAPDRLSVGPPRSSDFSVLSAGLPPWFSVGFNSLAVEAKVL